MKTALIIYAGGKRRVPVLAHENGLAVTQTRDGFSLTHLRSGRKMLVTWSMPEAFSALETMAPLWDWTTDEAAILRNTRRAGISEFFSLLVAEFQQ